MIDAKDPREIGSPCYQRNEHGALIRTAISRQQTLDDQGRCCGRKPRVYKRPDLHFFCGRCSREYGADGVQRPNWAFKANSSGEFFEARPIAKNEEAAHLSEFVENEARALKEGIQWE